VQMNRHRVLDERYQAVDHQTRRFDGNHIGSHPLIVVATLNNVFADTGRTKALIRPVPVAVDLHDATRESVMDADLWIYRVMSRELVTEKKIKPEIAWTGSSIADPRSYVYVEGHLELQGTAVAAAALDADGVWHFSHGGIPALAVA